MRARTLSQNWEARRCTAREAGLRRRLPRGTRTCTQSSASLESGAAAAERSSSSGGWGARQPTPRLLTPAPRLRLTCAWPAPGLHLACASPHVACRACDEAAPTDRDAPRGRFDAAHDSWELEDNVSVSLADAFRKGCGGQQSSEYAPDNVSADNVAASRKERRQQYSAGDLGPEPTRRAERRQREGESSHETEEDRRPRGAVAHEPKTLLPDDVKAVLTNWCLENLDNPYPNEREKMDICAATRLTFTQVNNWCVPAVLEPEQGDLRRSAPSHHAVSNVHVSLPPGAASLCKCQPPPARTSRRAALCIGSPTGASASGRRSRPTSEQHRARGVRQAARVLRIG